MQASKTVFTAVPMKPHSGSMATVMAPESMTSPWTDNPPKRLLIADQNVALFHLDNFFLRKF